MYSYNNLWEWGLGWVTDYETLIKFSIWHQFMTKYYQYRSICIEINRHDNVVITTTSVTKCIFLNFGAIPKRMVKVAKLSFHKLKLQCRVHNIYLQKIKLNKVFTEKNNLKLKIPTLFLFLLFFPYPSFPPWSFSLLPFDISCKILKHTFSKKIIGTP